MTSWYMGQKAILTSTCMKFLEATRQAGIKLNYDKCIIKTKTCNFFGNVYTPTGVKPDPEKVEAIKKMEAPINKQQLQSFLGMVTYLG